MSKAFSLSEHLAQEHKMTPFQTYLKEIVYGGSDGIVTTFAVVAGFTGAGAASSSYPFFIVLLFGFANLFADGVSMALGNFLSLRSEQDMYKTHEEKELQEIKHNTKSEEAESLAILTQKGFTRNQAQDLVAIYKTNEVYWLSFMMNHELKIPNPKGENPFATGIATFLSFIIFGLIPLSPYVILKQTEGVFSLSLLATFCALVLLGLLRFRATRENITRSVGEIVLIGSISAAVAFIVGTFFRT